LKENSITGRGEVPATAIPFVFEMTLVSPYVPLCTITVSPPFAFEAAVDRLHGAADVQTLPAPLGLAYSVAAAALAGAHKTAAVASIPARPLGLISEGDASTAAIRRPDDLEPPNVESMSRPSAPPRPA
jgi:hypothetical protein